MHRLRAAFLVLAIAEWGCAPPAGPGAPGQVRSDSSVILHGHPLQLHLSKPVPPRDGPLLVYATGDAGWFRGDRALFEHLATFGYPAVGFSSREYLRHLGPGVDVIRSGVVAADWVAVIRAAQDALGLGLSTRAVLVGKSRGAGLEIAAAAEPLLRDRLTGIIAVGLTREEEYVRSRFWHRTQRGGMLDTYAALAAIPDLPVAVIQSTRDGYVPASEARDLIGSDRADRHVRPIDSRNHNFAGAHDVLYDAVQEELQWIVDR